MYVVGWSYVWQNCEGENAFLNGRKTTVVGPPEEWVDQETLEIIWAQITDTVCEGSKSGFFVATAGRLTPKSERAMSQCQGKERMTKEMAYKLSKRYKTGATDAYKCKYCQQWHIGRRDKTRAKQPKVEMDYEL